MAPEEGAPQCPDGDGGKPSRAAPDLGASERDVVYFGEKGPGEADKPPALLEKATWSRTYESNPVMIFRLSAVRFNSHRIHYDRDCTTTKEGCPGLVVPVTLISYLMMKLCRAEAPERSLTAFGYRPE